MNQDSTETFADAFGLLADQRRLVTVVCLRERGEPTPVSALASEVAMRECPSGEVSDEAVDRVRVALRHAHIPKLVEAGVLAYDDAGRVRLTDDAADVERVLDAVFRT